MTTRVPCVHTPLNLGLTVTFFAITAAVAPKAEETGHHRYHGSDYRTGSSQAPTFPAVQTRIARR